MASSRLGPAEIVDSGALLATLIPPPASPPQVLILGLSPVVEFSPCQLPTEEGVILGLFGR